MIQNKELLKFIKSKKNKSIKIENNKISFYYFQLILEALIKSFNKLKNIYYSIELLNIVSNIFWVIYFHTYNIKLAIFLSNRSILLFNEYIDIAKTKFFDNYINITDTKLFIYNKTIGPLIFNENKNKKLSIIQHSCICFSNIFIKVFKFCIKNKYNLEFHLNYLNKAFHSILLKLSFKNLFNVIKKLIFDFKINLSLYNSINTLYIQFFFLNYLYNKYNTSKANHLFNKIKIIHTYNNKYLNEKDLKFIFKNLLKIK